MWAIRKLGPEPGLDLVETPVPTIGDDDVLVRVEAASLCGTDLHIFHWDDWAANRIQPPVTLGHEFAGTVVEVGRNVRHVAGRATTSRPRATSRAACASTAARARRTCASRRRSSASTATAPSRSTWPCPSR